MVEIFPDTEHALLKEISQGSETAFATIFHGYRDRVYSYSVKMLQSEETAKEVTQDVFMKLWISRAKLAEVISLDAYIFTIARNHCFNLLKRLALERKAGLHLAGLSEVDNHTEETIHFNEYRRLLDKAIASLPARQREVYILSYVEGMKRNEVAEKMGISPETVKSQLALAVAHIRNSVGKDHVVLALVLLSRWT